MNYTIKEIHVDGTDMAIVHVRGRFYAVINKSFDRFKSLEKVGAGYAWELKDRDAIDGPLAPTLYTLDQAKNLIEQGWGLAVMSRLV